MCVGCPVCTCAVCVPCGGCGCCGAWDWLNESACAAACFGRPTMLIAPGCPGLALAQPEHHRRFIIGSPSIP